MTPGDLEVAWSGLGRPPSEAVLAAVSVGAAVWAATDRAGLRHLLLEVPEGTGAPDTTTRGLRMSVAAHQVAGQETAVYLDLTCLSTAVLPTFTAVAADVATVGSALPPSARTGAVVDALARWRWFWGVDTDGLSEREALGLFGELWFLYRWTSCDPDAVAGWTGSSGARHDFQWPDDSVEVKVARSRSDGAVVHRIQSLDQLADPERGALWLFSLAVTADELAHNTLPGLVDLVDDRLAGQPLAAGEFARRLAERGYNPAHRRLYQAAWRILSETLYGVRDGFPRLTVGSLPDPLPPGVAGISYTLDMAVCTPWRIATRPAEWSRPGAGTPDGDR